MHTRTKSVSSHLPLKRRKLREFVHVAHTTDTVLPAVGLSLTSLEPPPSVDHKSLGPLAPDSPSKASPREPTVPIDALDTTGAPVVTPSDAPDTPSAAPDPQNASLRVHSPPRLQYDTIKLSFPALLPSSPRPNPSSDPGGNASTPVNSSASLHPFTLPTSSTPLNSSSHPNTSSHANTSSHPSTLPNHSLAHHTKSVSKSHASHVSPKSPDSPMYPHSPKLILGHVVPKDVSKTQTSPPPSSPESTLSPGNRKAKHESRGTDQAGLPTDQAGPTELSHADIHPSQPKDLSPTDPPKPYPNTTSLSHPLSSADPGDHPTSALSPTPSHQTDTPSTHDTTSSNTSVNSDDQETSSHASHTSHKSRAASGSLSISTPVASTPAVASTSLQVTDPSHPSSHPSSQPPSSLSQSSLPAQSSQPQSPSPSSTHPSATHPPAGTLPSPLPKTEPISASVSPRTSISSHPLPSQPSQSQSQSHSSQTQSPSLPPQSPSLPGRMDIDPPTAPAHVRTKSMPTLSTHTPSRTPSRTPVRTPSQPSVDRVVTRVSSGAIRQKSVSEILGETPRPSHHHQHHHPSPTSSAAPTPNQAQAASTPSSRSSESKKMRKNSQSGAIVSAQKSSHLEKGKSKSSTLGPSTKLPTAKNRVSKVVFGKPKLDEKKQFPAHSNRTTALEDRGIVRQVVPNDNYFTPLFVQTFFQSSKSLRPLEELLYQSHKTIETRDSHLSSQELQACRILKKVYHLQQRDKWSLRQPKRSVEPVRPPSHWDLLLGEMRWMRTDFREERKWKMAVARNLAHDCAEWVAATPSQRLAMQVPAVLPPPPPPPRLITASPQALDDDDGEEHPPLATFVPSPKQMAVDMNMDADTTEPSPLTLDPSVLLSQPDAKTDPDAELALSSLREVMPPSTMFTLANSEVVFGLDRSPAVDELLAELPLYAPPLRVLSGHLATPEFNPDAHWRRPALPLSRYVEGDMKLMDVHPPTPTRRFAYAEEDEEGERGEAEEIDDDDEEDERGEEMEEEVEAEMGTVEEAWRTHGDTTLHRSSRSSRFFLARSSAQSSVHTGSSTKQLPVIALFCPDMQHLRDRLHAGHQFRPPSEFSMPTQSFFEHRQPSLWTMAEEEELKGLVRQFSYNWSFISSVLHSRSAYHSGAERRTPWECFERWIMLEGLPADMQKTQYFKAYNNRIEQAQRNLAQQYQAAQQQAAAAGTTPPTVKRRSAVPQRVESRRNQRYLSLLEAMAKLAKTREVAEQKKLQQQQAQAQKKPVENFLPPVPHRTAYEYSLIRAERDKAFAEKLALYTQRQELQRRQALQARQLQMQALAAGHAQGGAGGAGVGGGGNVGQGLGNVGQGLGNNAAAHLANGANGVLPVGASSSSGATAAMAARISMANSMALHQQQQARARSQIQTAHGFVTATHPHASSAASLGNYGGGSGGSGGALAQGTPHGLLHLLPGANGQSIALPKGTSFTGTSGTTLPTTTTTTTTTGGVGMNGRIPSTDGSQAQANVLLQARRISEQQRVTLQQMQQKQVTPQQQPTLQQQQQQQQQKHLPLTPTPSTAHHLHPSPHQQQQQQLLQQQQQLLLLQQQQQQLQQLQQQANGTGGPATSSSSSSASTASLLAASSASLTTAHQQQLLQARLAQQNAALLGTLGLGTGNGNGNGTTGNGTAQAAAAAAALLRNPQTNALLNGGGAAAATNGSTHGPLTSTPTMAATTTTLASTTPTPMAAAGTPTLGTTSLPGGSGVSATASPNLASLTNGLRSGLNGLSQQNYLANAQAIMASLQNGGGGAHAHHGTGTTATGAPPGTTVTTAGGLVTPLTSGHANGVNRTTTPLQIPQTLKASFEQIEAQLRVKNPTASAEYLRQIATNELTRMMVMRHNSLNMTGLSQSAMNVAAGGTTTTAATTTTTTAAAAAGSISATGPGTSGPSLTAATLTPPPLAMASAGTGSGLHHYHGLGTPGGGLTGLSTGLAGSGMAPPTGPHQYAALLRQQQAQQQQQAIQQTRQTNGPGTPGPSPAQLQTPTLPTVGVLPTVGAGNSNHGSTGYGSSKPGTPALLPAARAPTGQAAGGIDHSSPTMMSMGKPMASSGTMHPAQQQQQQQQQQQHRNGPLASSAASPPLSVVGAPPPPSPQLSVPSPILHASPALSHLSMRRSPSVHSLGQAGPTAAAAPAKGNTPSTGTGNGNGNGLGSASGTPVMAPTVLGNP